MRSKTFMSKINLQRGKLTVENRKSREKKTDMLRSIVKQSGESDFMCFIIENAVSRTYVLPTSKQKRSAKSFSFGYFLN